MAQWKETLEPYIRVHEKIKVAALNPVAGEDLIIGCAFISDAGPSLPTLITSQKEFLETYSSQDITEKYITSLDKFYTGDGDPHLGSSMWLNAYRLAGSNTLLAVRATKAKDLYYAKTSAYPNNDFIVRDGQVLKKVSGEVKFCASADGDSASWSQYGWAIKLRDIGVVGNLNKDGVVYDYYIDNLVDLVNYLNDTSLFFSPNYTFHTSVNNTDDNAVSEDSLEEDSKKGVMSVVFKELYLGSNILEGFTKKQYTLDTPVYNENLESTNPTYGLQNIIVCEENWTAPNQENPTQGLIALNDSSYSGFEQEDVLGKGYVTNVYNSCTDLKVRIRRFNHDAVATKQLTKPDANENGASPYSVLTSVITSNTSTPAKAEHFMERDFYEIAVFDPSVSGEVLYFNLGTVLSLGDMELVDINNSLKMVQISLPEKLSDLGLGYYFDNQGTASVVVAGSGDAEYCYDLQIKTGDDGSAILNVSNSDILKALDQIPLNEVYTVEGLTDLGCTEPMVQSYMANMAINDNFFYPISTVNSTNYLAIANSILRISQDFYKLYASAPWDVDTGTMGWKFYCSPSVLYWETVGRNRRLGREFAPVLGQTNGIAQYQKPVAEFNKKTRQLLLSKKINTVLWDVQTQAWDWNDNYTKQTENNIMSDEANSRLMIRISKAMPVLLRQFIGRRIGAVLWNDMYNVIDYWFKTTILGMTYTIDGYRITIDESNNTPEDARANRVNVLVEVRYQRAAKYIEVYNNAFDVGMEFDGIM